MAFTGFDCRGRRLELSFIAYFLPSVFLQKFKAVMPPNPNRGKIREFSLGIELEIFLLQVRMSC